MDKIKFYLQRIYRLSLNYNKQEAIVWQELKKLHIEADWKHGVFENEKYIETIFELGKEKGGAFYYMIHEGMFHCRVKILENYPSDLTTEIFILAAHFNNLLKDGVVTVDVQNSYVGYSLKRNILIPLLYSGMIHNEVVRHYNVSQDIYSAFQRLIIENEAPAIIYLPVFLLILLLLVVVG